MLKIMVEEEDRIKARAYCMDARQWFAMNKINNNRAFLSQGNALNYDGILAEFVVARYFGGEHNDLQAFDKGVDVVFSNGLKVDVKIIRNGGFYLIEFPEDVELKTNDVYILGRWKDNQVQLLGWVRRDQFVKKASKKDFGYGERLVMNCNDLNKDFDVFGVE